MTDRFEQAFAATVGEEGAFGDDRRDRGNWTGGRVGVGELRGTKYGVSAAAYPTLDIRALTLDGARAIYRRDYWDRCRCGAMPAELAGALFDAAVNSGAGGAVKMLQRALGVTDDGAIGPRTVEAVLRVAARPEGGRELLDLFHAERLLVMAGDPAWPTYGRGWARRVLRVHRRAATAA